MTTIETVDVARATLAETESSISGQLGAFVAGTEFDDLPAHVVEIAKGRILDALATGFAARDLPVPAVATVFAGSAQGPSTVLGSTTRRTVVDAAFINGTLVNGCTHDDYVGKLHAGAVVIPAALAVGEAQGVSGATLLASIVLGYDVGARIYFGGTDMHPRFRGTGVAGAIGAAAGAAKAMGLSALEASHAIGLSPMFASGLNEGFVAGTKDVKLNVGWAARTGASCALLAAAGATASPTAFEGPKGYFQAYARSCVDIAETTRGLGQHYFIEDTLFKERPVCIFVQTPLQLAWNLANEHGLSGRAIDRVVLTVPLASRDNPGHMNVAPFTGQLQARISVRFTVASALLGRPVEDYRYYDRFDDPAVLELIRKIDVEVGSDDHTVSLVVEADGRRFETHGLEMDNLTASLDKSIAKYERLTADLPAPAMRRILEGVLGIDRMGDVCELTELLREVVPAT